MCARPRKLPDAIPGPEPWRLLLTLIAADAIFWLKEPMMAWVAFEPMLLGSLTLGSSAAPFDLLHDAMRALLGLQREIQRNPPVEATFA